MRLRLHVDEVVLRVVFFVALIVDPSFGDCHILLRAVVQVREGAHLYAVDLSCDAQEPRSARQGAQTMREYVLS